MRCYWCFFCLDWECDGIFMVMTLVPATGLRPTAGLPILPSHGFGVILDWLVYPSPLHSLGCVFVSIYTCGIRTVNGVFTARLDEPSMAQTLIRIIPVVHTMRFFSCSTLALCKSARPISATMPAVGD
ncbi:hypothetical protein BJX68DRAFT_8257 [Aspergillus pseudodeflectus]|uniref:Secreted protein n=1 Tax=Aspergillus pseudodeflectus TaxID=176178 RepID=A0ABR4LAJ5_9EURO